MLDGTTCVLADAGAGGSGGQPSDGGTGGAAGSGGIDVTCGPGRVLKDNECVPADTVTDGLAVETFTATTLWGDVPLDTTLTWSIRAPQGTTFSCELDTDGDGTFETPVPNCAAVGEHDVTYDTYGQRSLRFASCRTGASGPCRRASRSSPTRSFGRRTS